MTLATVPLLHRLLAVAVVGTILSALLYFHGPAVVRWTLPFQAWAIEQFQPLFGASLFVFASPEGFGIVYQPVSLQSIPLTDKLSIPAASRFPPSATSLIHSMLPQILLWTPIVAWPFKTCAEAVVRCVFGAFGTLITLAASAPLLLAASLQMRLNTVATDLGGQPLGYGLINSMMFMEMGGCWMLPLACALVCVSGATRLAARPAEAGIKGAQFLSR